MMGDGWRRDGCWMTGGNVTGHGDGRGLTGGGVTKYTVLGRYDGD